MKIVWPRALIRGSTTTMWIESTTISRNVTVRLADDDRLFEDKTIPIFSPGLFFFLMLILLIAYIADSVCI